MGRTFKRLQTQFYRISLRTEKDSQTLALVPDLDHAQLIERLLRENYGLRPGEQIVLSPTTLRPAKSNDDKGVEWVG
jgi:hypothetical protein